MTEWERTNDAHWRDRILAGVDSIVAMPFGLETGKPPRAIPPPRPLSASIMRPASSRPSLIP